MPHAISDSTGAGTTPSCKTSSGDYDRILHGLAIATAVATFPLIFMGGLVTSHGAGLAVPDWPNTYGYNMFLFPPSKWVGGIFYEHVHRLAGSLVGLLSIAVTVYAWTRHRRLRWLAAAMLAAVIFQGVLGGLRVIWVNLDLAIVHACVAQAFFCFTAFMVAATSRWWKPGAATADAGRAFQVPLVRFAAVAVAIIYLQLIAGAVMRHYQAGLAIPDYPFAYGQILPPLDAAQIQSLNQWRQQQADLNFQTVTRGQIWIHFIHRIGAILVVVAVGRVVVEALKRYRQLPLVSRPAMLLIALVIAQFTLGILTVLWRKPADIASTHVAVGALTLLTTFTLLVRAIRLHNTGRLAPLPAPQPGGSSDQLPVNRAIPT